MSTGAIVLLIILGIVLLILEFLIVPGVTIAGIGGFLCLGGAIFTAYHTHGVTFGNITLLSTIGVLIIGLVISIKTGIWKKVMLESNVEGVAIDVKNDNSFNVGDRGKTITRLAPIGKALINNKIVEAKSTGGFLDENIEIEIIKIQNNNVVVKPLK